MKRRLIALALFLALAVDALLFFGGWAIGWGVCEC